MRAKNVDVVHPAETISSLLLRVRWGRFNGYFTKHLCMEEFSFGFLNTGKDSFRFCLFADRFFDLR